MENNKTQAELYREERKARLAKAAAKKAKKSPAAQKTKKIVTKVVAIVLAVVIGLGAIYGVLNFFGAPQKMIKVTVEDTDYQFSLAEYNYYYYNIVMNYIQTSYQYDSYYGAGTGLSYIGYDYSKTPQSQEYKDDYSSVTGYTLEEIGNPEDPKWSDAFRCMTIDQIIQVKLGVAKAKEKGIKLTEAEKTTIDKNIDSMRSSAKTNDYSLNRYLHSNFGKGITETLLRQISEEQTLATNYYTAIQEEMYNAVTSEQVNEKYNANPDAYDITTLRIYGIEIKSDAKKDATEEEKAAALEEAKKKVETRINAVFSEITDEESFIKQAELDVKLYATEEEKKDYDGKKSTAADDITYATLENSSEELAKWTYDDARKVGDKTIIKTDDIYYVALMLELPHKDTSSVSNNVRHILIKFPDKNTDGSATTKKDDKGNTVANITDATKAETKKKAQAVLDEYLKNPTEENFIALTKKHTDDVDKDGKPNNDGLYENVSSSSNYVANFKNWAINASRKPGDTGIVETEYGYHIMYYVSAGAETWFETVKTEIYNAEYSAATDKLIEEYYNNVDKDSLIIKWTTNKQNDLIAKIVAYNFS